MDGTSELLSNKNKKYKNFKMTLKKKFRIAQISQIQDWLGVEIRLNYIQTTIRIFREGKYLNIFVVGPNRLLKGVSF